MWPAFEQAVARYQEVEKLLADPTVIGDRAGYTKLAKEHGSLARMVKPFQEYEKIADGIAQAEGLLAAETDAGMRQMIEEELAGLRPRQEALHAKLEDQLLAEGEDFDSIIMEIRAGTGGRGTALFACDLYDTYTHSSPDHGCERADNSFYPR